MNQVASSRDVTAGSGGMKTITTALQMLGLFNAYAPEWTIRDLAERMKLPYSTAYRYVNSLIAVGYLEPSVHTGKYHVGLPVIELAGVVLNQLDVRVHGKYYLERLADATGMNANMSVLYQADILHVAFAMRNQANDTYEVIGRRSPAHLTAMGKTMLADLYFGDVRKLIERHGWRTRTPNSIRCFSALEQELHQAREWGYALEEGEYDMQSRCVAAPIRSRLGRVVAAISVSGQASKIRDDWATELPRIVMDYAAMISHHLGYNELIDTDPGMAANI